MFCSCFLICIDCHVLGIKFQFHGTFHMGISQFVRKHS